MYCVFPKTTVSLSSICFCRVFDCHFNAPNSIWYHPLYLLSQVTAEIEAAGISNSDNRTNLRFRLQIRHWLLFFLKMKCYSFCLPFKFLKTYFYFLLAMRYQLNKELIEANMKGIYLIEGVCKMSSIKWIYLLQVRKTSTNSILQRNNMIGRLKRSEREIWCVLILI